MLSLLLQFSYKPKMLKIIIFLSISQTSLETHVLGVRVLYIQFLFSRCPIIVALLCRSV